MKKIIYKGVEYNTIYDYELLSDEEFEYLRKEYYKKPSFDKVEKEFINISKGGFKNTDITNWYVRDLMDKVLNYKTKWSTLSIKSLTYQFVISVFLKPP